MKIGFKQTEYDKYMGKEEQIKDCIESLRTIGKKILGVDKIEDLPLYIAEPSIYLAETFFEMYGQNEPPHTNRIKYITSKVDFDITGIDKLHSDYLQLIKDMGVHAPSLTKSGIRSNLKESSFNLILDENKRDEYEAVSSFLEAAKVLHEKYNAKSTSFIRGFHHGITSDHMKPFVNPYNYAKR